MQGYRDKKTVADTFGGKTKADVKQDKAEMKADKKALKQAEKEYIQAKNQAMLKELNKQKLTLKSLQQMQDSLQMIM